MEYQIKSSHIQRHLHLLCQIPDALRAGDDDKSASRWGWRQKRFALGMTTKALRAGDDDKSASRWGWRQKRFTLGMTTNTLHAGDDETTVVTPQSISTWNRSHTLACGSLGMTGCKCHFPAKQLK
jgi:hypothetical protein